MLLIAGLLGVLAIGGTALLLTRGPAAAPAVAPVAGTPVALTAPTPAPQMRYIANRDIPPRTVLTSDMLRRTAISGPMPAGAITSLDDVRGLITNKVIRSGDTVSDDSFVQPLERVIPANFTIPSGFRAVAIYVNPAQTAAGLVDVGDRVDVIATQKLEFDKQPNQYVVGAKQFTTGRTIGTNLLVLAVEDSIKKPAIMPTPAPAAGTPPAAPGAPAAAAGGAPAAPGAPLPADAAPPPAGGTAPAEVRDKPEAAPTGNIRVILAAPLETASRLVAANEGGTLHVVVRNPLDGDAEASPETREYPSRTITVKQPLPNIGGGGGSSRGGGSSGPAFPVPDLPPITTTSQSSAPPLPMPVPVSVPDNGGGQGSGGMGMTAPSQPSGPPMRDVMVVRGTEKTRVIVPKR